MMRLSKIFTIIFIASIIEAILNFRIFYVRAEIILIVLVFFSLKVNSKRNALFLGGFAGFLKDIIAISPFGQHVLIFIPIAVLLNWSKKFFYEIPEYLPVIATGTVLFFYSLIFLLAKSFATDFNINAKALFFVLLVIFINSLVTPFIFKILKKCA